MAEYTHAVWLILVYLLAEILPSFDAALSLEVLNTTSFDCKLGITDTNWTMECESQDSAPQSKFYVVKLRGFSNLTSPLTYGGLLNSTSFGDAKFHSCNSQLRYFIQIDPSALLSQCQNDAKQSEMKKMILIMKEEFVKSMTISHVSRPDLALNILSDCSHLEDVIISDNSIPELALLPFRADHNLVTSLRLKRDEIANISDKIFSALSNLSSLDLSHNLLRVVRKELFEGVKALSFLDMSNNLIDFISDDAFLNLSSLKSLFLGNNKLKSISGHLFRFNNLLSVVDLHNNDLKYLPVTLFNNLTNLKNISCSNCSLFDLHKDMFLNSPHLDWMNFSCNYLQVLPLEMFRTLKQLRVVDLGSNNISYLDENLLPNHPYMNYINLTNNKISSLRNGIFTGAPDIRFIDLSRNKLRTLTDDHIKNFTDLEYFSLHHNELEKVELGLKSWVKIRRLYIYNNYIKELNIGWKKLVFMEKFIADDNQLTSIDLPPCIPINVKQTLTFSFKRNRISRVNMDALISDEDRAKTDRTMAGCFFNGLAKNFIDLTDNPLFCDCKLYPFYNYAHKKSPRRFEMDMLMSKGNLTCEGPPFLKGKRLVSISDDVISCPISENCPPSCRCGIRGKDDFIFVNCSSRNLTGAPHVAPNGTTALYINGNKLTSMASLNAPSWNELRELHVDDNSLTNLDGWVFPPSLRYLSVRGNKLKTLPPPLMKFISNLTHFRLFFGNNDQNCDCDRKTTKSFLLQNIQFIEDNEDILCIVTSNDTSVLLPLTSVPDSDICPASPGILTTNQNRLIISLCIFFIFLIVLVLVYYNQQDLILSFLYIHCDELFRLFYVEENDDKMFDAFVAYSSSDREIVFKLLQELESNPPYFRLCIHERNWLPGHFIMDNIVNSVECSRRTIVVLSSTFISSPWFNLELRAAVFKMSKDKTSRIIVILADKSISLDNIDPEIRHVISKRTYLVWGERWFWEKLRYVMPRKKKNVKSSHRRNHSKNSISEMALVPEV